VDELLTTRRGRDCTVVQVRGELDMQTAPQLRESLQGLIEAGDRRIVLDLAEVSFMDSSALGAVVTVFRSLSDAGGHMALAAVQPGVRTVLHITSVDQVLAVYDTAELAEAGLSAATS
jgi:anti-sigma B factor antagonist